MNHQTIVECGFDCDDAFAQMISWGKEECTGTYDYCGFGGGRFVAYFSELSDLIKFKLKFGTS